jgi:2-polyprenyl-6-hydroxyphenyl methylase / 3-demethylubiquinone-9 3-methyltransferase
MSGANASPSLDPTDVARFEALAQEWWDPSGPMRALHQINPLRIAWLLDLIAGHFGAPRTPDPTGRLAGISILDIGCGAGLLSEPLARLGADVTGLDPAAGNIEVARRHAEETGAHPTYHASTVEEFAAHGATFDVVLAMEVVEHVRDVRGFVKTACGLTRPGGLFAASTLNRTLRSFALAIIAAEYILGWTPKGVHRWEKFVTPDELRAACLAAGCQEKKRVGVVYDPLRGGWRLSSDTSVNYMIAAKQLGLPAKPAYFPDGQSLSTRSSA